MKVDTITYLNSSSNYGQILQAYALQRCLQNLGFESEVIRFIGLNSKRSLFAKIHGISVEKLLDFISGKRARRKLDYLERRRRDSMRGFGDFIDQHIRVTRAFDDITQLRNEPPVADAYICGSDQIWGRPLLDNNTAAWFLDFVPEGAPRISYAASIGRELNSDELPLLAGYLDNFHSIGVREKDAAEVCRSLGYDAKVVLDPTMLLETDTWLSLASEVSCARESYLFAYFLNVQRSSDVSWSETQEWLSGEHLGVRAVYSDGYLPARAIIPNVEPEYLSISEWLAAFRDANSVVTTSFHGTAFSILFHRPFISFPLKGRDRSNTRLITLLSSLGLENRIYNPRKSIKEQMKAGIDWDKVDDALAELKAESFNFITTSLASVSPRNGQL